MGRYILFMLRPRFLPQTLQGADIISKSINGQVIIPDFFDGNTVKPEWFADQSEENQRKVQEWFGTTGNFLSHVSELHGVVDTVKAQNEGAKVGAIGYCWGKSVRFGVFS